MLEPGEAPVVARESVYNGYHWIPTARPYVRGLGQCRGLADDGGLTIDGQRGRPLL